MRSAVLAILLLALPVFADAHDTWILPSRWSVPAGAPLVVDLTSAMNFPRPDSAAHPDRLVDRKVRLGGVVSSLAVSPGGTGAKALRLTATRQGAGLATLWITTRPRTLDLKPNEVEEYLREVGASETIGEQWRCSPDRSWRETYVKVAKTFVRVGGTSKDDSWGEVVGASLELVPTSDPTRVTAGEELGFVVRVNGEPQGGVAVGAVGGTGATSTLTRSDASGAVRFRLDQSGPWLFRATVIRPAQGRPGEWESVFTTVTVSVKP